METIAIEELLGHAGWMRDLARCLTHEDADDLVQEAWLAALSRPPRREGNARGWLGEIVRNSWRMRGRGDIRRKARESTSANVESVAGADELAEEVELGRVLAAALLALEEPYRETLLLSFYGSLTSAEIAQRRGVPASTVRSHIKTGLERLRDALDRRYGNRATWKRALMPLTTPLVKGGIMFKVALGLLLAGGGAAGTAAIVHHANETPVPVSEAPHVRSVSSPSNSADPHMANVREEHDRLLARIMAKHTAPLPTRSRPATVPNGGATMTPEDGLDKEYVRAAIKDILPLVKECYEQGLVDNPNLQGRILLQFTIAGDPDVGGVVASSEVVNDQSTMTDPAVRECIQESIYAARFPAPTDNGVVTVDFPFVLLSAEDSK